MIYVLGYGEYSYHRVFTVLKTDLYNIEEQLEVIQKALVALEKSLPEDKRKDYQDHPWGSDEYLKALQDLATANNIPIVIKEVSHCEGQMKGPQLHDADGNHVVASDIFYTIMMNKIKALPYTEVVNYKEYDFDIGY